MTALSADAPKTFIEVINGGVIVEYGILASEVIYRGAACSVDSSGYLNANQGDEAFVGIALEQKTGSATDGAITAKVQVGGYVVVTLASVTIASVGTGCFAADDGTYSLANTTSDSIGRIIHVPATGTAWVALKAPGADEGQAATVGGA